MPPGRIDGIDGSPKSPPEAEEKPEDGAPSEDHAPRISDVPYMTGDYHVGGSRSYAGMRDVLRQRRDLWRKMQERPGIFEYLYDATKKLIFDPVSSILEKIVKKLKGGGGSPPSAPTGGSDSTPSSASPAPSQPSSTTSYQISALLYLAAAARNSSYRTGYVTPSFSAFRFAQPLYSMDIFFASRATLSPSL